jgi:hypothetical protein
VATINIYTNLYLEDHFSLKNFVVEKINNWLLGKEKLPEYRVMRKYIRDSPKLQAISDLIYKDTTYRDLRDRCNNHLHYNFYRYTLLNDNEVVNIDRLAILTQLSRDLESVFIFHLAYLFYLNDHYMMASDYVDSLDLGLIPEDGSENYVAPFIQDIFDTVIQPTRPDLAAAIKGNTAMRLQ